MKTRRIVVALFAAASMVALSGCSASCEDVCGNAVDLCEREITEGRSDKETERTACLERCRAAEEAPETCENIDEVKDCVLDAESCTDVGDCPECQAK